MYFRLIGFKRIFLLVITSSVGAILARNLFVFGASIDSLTPVCGLIGYMLGMFIINRNRQWRYYSGEKVHMLLTLSVLIGLYIQIAILYTNISLVTEGIAALLGFIFYFCDPAEKMVKCKVLAIGILSIFIGIVVFLFFFWSNPPKIAK